MTPKEKAEELVNKYLCVQDYYKRDSGCRITEYEAKQGALIAVDEVMRSHHNLYGVNNKSVKFYLEVKQEIEKI